MPLFVFKVAMVKERSLLTGKLLRHDGFKPLCWDTTKTGSNLSQEIKKFVYPNLKEKAKIFTVGKFTFMISSYDVFFGLFFCNSKYWIDAEGDEIELARGNETVGLEEENSLWQFITMLDKKFDTSFGLVKLFIEEPVEPSPFTVRIN